MRVKYMVSYNPFTCNLISLNHTRTFLNNLNLQQSHMLLSLYLLSRYFKFKFRPCSCFACQLVQWVSKRGSTTLSDPWFIIFFFFSQILHPLFLKLLYVFVIIIARISMCSQCDQVQDWSSPRTWFCPKQMTGCPLQVTGKTLPLV